MSEKEMLQKCINDLHKALNLGRLSDGTKVNADVLNRDLIAMQKAVINLESAGKVKK